MRKSAGLGGVDGEQPTIRDSVSEFRGTWSEEDERAVLEGLMLDTNAYTAYLCADPPVTVRVDSTAGILLPAAVVGELLYGFRSGTVRSELQSARTLSCQAVRGVRPGYDRDLSSIWVGGRRAETGRTPIPVNDVWVATHAQQTGASLLTYDAHFDRVAGMSVVHLGA